MNRWSFLSAFILTAVASPVEIFPSPTPTPTVGSLAARDDITSITNSLPIETGVNYNTFLSHYLDGDGKWTASNTVNITQVQTFTKDGEKTTKTVEGPVAIVTGLSEDLNVLISPELRMKLSNSLNGAHCHLKRSTVCSLERTIAEIFDSDDPTMKNFRSMISDIKFFTEDVLQSDEVQALVAGLEAMGATVQAEAVKKGLGAAAFAYFFADLYWQSSRLEAYSITKPPDNDIPTVSHPDDDKCREDAPSGEDAPRCSECDGEENKCTSGENRGCSCLTTSTVIAYAIDEETFDNTFKMQQTIFDEAFKYAKEFEIKPNVTCSSQHYREALTLDKSFVKKMAKEFCSKDLDKETTTNLTSSDIDSTAYSDFTFEFFYTPAGEDSFCANTCNDAFDAIIPHCQGQDAHSIQPSGSTKFSCGASYGYNIYQPDRGSPNGADILIQTDLSCGADNPDNIGVNRDQLISNAKDYCDQVKDAGDWTRQNSLEEDYDSTDGMATIVFKAMAPGKLLKRNEDEENYSLHPKDCLHNFMTLIDGCNTDTTDRKMGGLLETKDGSAWTIGMRDAGTKVVSCSNTQTALLTIKRANAEAQIENFCKTTPHDDDLPTTREPKYYRWSNIQGGTLVLNLRWSENQDGCSEAKPGDTFWPKNCYDDLMMAIDGCDTDTTTMKRGGKLKFSSSTGCWDGLVSFPAGKDADNSDIVW